MYVVYINLLYFLSIFLFTYNKNLLSPKNSNMCSIFTKESGCRKKNIEIFVYLNRADHDKSVTKKN